VSNGVGWFDARFAYGRRYGGEEWARCLAQGCIRYAAPVCFRVCTPARGRFCWGGEAWLATG
jgi:hypothetical protein